MDMADPGVVKKILDKREVEMKDPWPYHFFHSLFVDSDKLQTILSTTDYSFCMLSYHFFIMNFSVYKKCTRFI